MENQKKSFLLYFDSYAMLAQLPPEQVGWLLFAVYRYADAVWRDVNYTIEETLELFPQLSEQAKVTFGYLASNLRRDTLRWLKQRERISGRSSAAQASAPSRPPVTPPLPEAVQYRAEMDQLLQQLRLLDKQEPQEPSGPDSPCRNPSMRGESTSPPTTVFR